MTDVRGEHRGEPRVMVFCEPQRKDIELVIAGEHRIEGGQDCPASLPSPALGHRRRCDAQRVWCHATAPALRAASSSRSEYSPWAFLSSERMTSLRSSTLLLAAFAPAPVSSEAVSRPLITRVSTPTLKNEMNFSCASISLRAEVGGLHPPCRAQDAVAIEREQAGEEARPRRFRRRL